MCSNPNAESTVSGDRVPIPARIRRESNISDGDRLRWRIETDGSVRVEIVRQRSRTFADFDGYDGDEDADVVVDHDQWEVE